MAQSEYATKKWKDEMLVYLVGLGAILVLVVFVGITFTRPFQVAHKKWEKRSRQKKRHAQTRGAVNKKRRRP